MLPQAKRHAELLVCQRRVVRRKVLGKLPLVVDGPTCYGAFQEPFAHAFLTATAQLARFAQQNGNMSGVAQFLSERQLTHMIRNFHPGTLTADAAGWRPPFRQATNTREADAGHQNGHQLIYKLR